LLCRGRDVRAPAPGRQLPRGNFVVGREYQQAIQRLQTRAGSTDRPGGRAMDCGEFLADYSDFLDGRCEAHSLSDYHYHLRRCSACAQYDRVMRCALQLVRQLDPPEANPGFQPRLRRCVFELAKQPPGHLAQKGSAAAVVGLAALGVIAVTSLAVRDRAGETVELPPVVVELSAGEEVPSLWGPAPKFTPAASSLRVPDFPRDLLLANPSQKKISLFRAGLGVVDLATDSAAVATE